MYQAKGSGRNTYAFYTPALTVTANERLDMEARLRHALTQGEFLLHYQPRLDWNEQVTGVEALIRWNRPGHGLQLPGRFIPIAEESDLIILIGEWVLAAIAAQLQVWRKAGVAVPSVAISL